MKIVTDVKKLRKKSKLLGEIEEKDLKKLIDDMEKTMLANKGIGLAGNQVGVYDQIFIMYMPEGNIGAVINPEIIYENKGLTMMIEGCLSLPDEKQRQVGRSRWIIAKYMNEKAEEVERNFKNEFAHIFLHEYEHLQGELFIDKV